MVTPSRATSARGALAIAATLVLLGSVPQAGAATWDRTFALDPSTVDAIDVVALGGGASVLVAATGWRSGLLLGLGPDGEILWSQNPAMRPTAVAALPDGGVVACGFANNGVPPNHGVLLRLTATGEPAWRVVYSHADQLELRDVAVTADDRIVAVGATGGTNAPLEGAVLVVAPDGTLLDSLLVGTPDADDLRRVATLPSGGFVAGGRSARSSASGSAWLLSFDAAHAVTWSLSMGSGAVSSLVPSTSGGVVVQGGPAHLARIAADGTAAWSRTLADPPRAFTLRPDGSIVFATSRHVGELAADGSVATWGRALPSFARAAAVAIDADGVFLAGSSPSTMDGWSMRLDSNGGLTAGCVLAPWAPDPATSSLTTSPLPVTTSPATLTEFAGLPSPGGLRPTWTSRCADGACIPQSPTTGFGVAGVACGSLAPLDTSQPLLTWTPPTTSAGMEWAVWPGPGCSGVPWAVGVAPGTATSASTWPPLVPGTWSFAARSLGDAGLTWCDEPVACACELVVDAGVPCGEDAREPDDDCASARDACLDCMPVAHALCDEDWMSFEARAGATYVIHTLGSTPATDPFLALHDSTCGAPLAADDGSGGGVEASIQWTATTDGTLHVRLTTADGLYGPGRATDVEVACILGCEASWDRRYSIGRRGFAAADGGAFLADGDALWSGPGAPLDPVPVLGKVAPDGSPQWAIAMREPSQYGAFTDAIGMPDGGVVAAGFHGQRNSDPAHYDPIVIRTDAAGNVVWLSHREAEDDERILALARAPGGDFVGIGDHIDSWNFPTPRIDDVLLVRVADDGTYGGQVRLSIPELFPNPARSLVARDVAVQADGDTLALVESGDPSGPVSWIVELTPGGGIIQLAGWETTAKSFAATADGGAVAILGGKLLRVGPDLAPAWCVRVTGMSLDDVAAGDASGVITISGLVTIDGVPQLVLAQLAPDGTLLRARRHDTTATFLERRADGTWLLSGDEALRQVRSQLGVDLGCARADHVDVLVEPAAVPRETWLPDGRLVTRGVATFPAASSPVAVATSFTSTSCPQLLRPFEVSPPWSRAPLRFHGLVMTWEDGSVSGSSSFDVFRGSLADLANGTPPSCVGSGVVAQTFVDPEPAGPSGTYYLVAGRNATGRGPLGADSHGDERADPGDCP